MVAASIPYQFYCLWQFKKNPALMRKYLTRGSFVSFGSLAYFFYAAYSHTSIEQKIYDKYLGNVTMDGLKALAAG